MTEPNETTMTDEQIRAMPLTDKHIRILRGLWCQPHLGGAGITPEGLGALAERKLVVGHDLTDIGHRKCHHLITSGAWCCIRSSSGFSSRLNSWVSLTVPSRTSYRISFHFPFLRDLIPGLVPPE